VKLTDDEAEEEADLKRKRLSEGDKDLMKKVKLEDDNSTSSVPQPPPPPPLTQDTAMDVS